MAGETSAGGRASAKKSTKKEVAAYKRGCGSERREAFVIGDLGILTAERGDPAKEITATVKGGEKITRGYQSQDTMRGIWKMEKCIYTLSLEKSARARWVRRVKLAFDDTPYGVNLRESS